MADVADHSGEHGAFIHTDDHDASHTDDHDASHKADDHERHHEAIELGAPSIGKLRGDMQDMPSPLHGFHDGVTISQLLSFTYFAIAFPEASPLRQVVDDALLKLIDGHVVFG